MKKVLFGNNKEDLQSALKEIKNMDLISFRIEADTKTDMEVTDILKGVKTEDKK